MNARTCFTLAVLLLSCSSLGAAERKPFVAVADLHVTGALSAGQSRMLTDVLRNTLIELDRFVILDRSNMDKIFTEQKLLLSGACDVASCQTRVGQLLGVEKIVTGTLGKVGTTYSLVIQLTNVSSGEIEATAEDSFRGEVDGLLGVIKQQAYKLCGLPVPLDLVLGMTVTTASGDMYVASEPPGATVFVDGRSVKGVTPLMVEKLPVGAHQLRVILGELSATKEVEVRKDGLEKLNLTLAKQNLILRVLTNPPEAEVFVGEKSMGLTPLTLEYEKPGAYSLIVRKEGFAEELHRGRLTIAATETVRLTLKPGVLLVVTSTPPGATVVLDGQERGLTPWTAPVALGQHELGLTLEGYERLSKELDLGKPVTLELTLTPIPAFLSVRCLPEGGTILLDGKEVGKDELKRYETTAGEHQVACGKQKTWLDTERTVTLVRGEQLELVVELNPQPSQVTLPNLPENFSLFVDETHVEQVETMDTPLLNLPKQSALLAGNTLFVPPGQHVLKLLSREYETEIRQLELDRAEFLTLTLHQRLKPAFAEHQRKVRRAAYGFPFGVALSGASVTLLLWSMQDGSDRDKLVERGNTKILTQAELDKLRKKANNKASSARWKGGTGFSLLGIGLAALGFASYNVFTLPDLSSATIGIAPLPTERGAGLALSVRLP